jgi:tetratricopeptide (TPR) repeat protein
VCLGEARAKATSAIALFFGGDNDAAIKGLEEASLIQSKLSDVKGHARSLRILGQIYYLTGEEGNSGRGSQLLKQSLDLYRAANDLLGQAQVLALLGEGAFAQAVGKETPTHSFEDALRHYQEAAELFEKTDDPLGEALTHYMLGMLLMSLHSDSEIRHYMTVTVPVPATMLGRSSRFNLAVGHLKKARDLYWEEGDLLSRAHTEVVLAAALHFFGASSASAAAHETQCLNDALKIYEQSCDASGQACVHWMNAQLEAGRRNFQGAKQRIERIQEIPQLPSWVTKTIEPWWLSISTHPPEEPRPRFFLFYIFRFRQLGLMGWSTAFRREATYTGVVFEIEGDALAESRPRVMEVGSDELA